MKYCSKCSEPLEDNFKFCTKCGNRIMDFAKSEIINVQEIETSIKDDLNSIKAIKKSNKGKLIAIICLILFGTLIYFFTKKENIKSNSPTEQIEAFSEKEQIEVFLKQFVNELNSNPLEINKYVDKKEGVVNFFYDDSEGFVTISEPKFINDEVNSNPLMINGDYVQFYEQVENNSFPEYLGAFEYKDYGFYFEKFENKKHMINSNNYGGEESRHTISPINNACNYVVQAMTTNGDYIFSFYFLIKNKKKQLLAYNIEAVGDLDFVSLKNDKKIPFNNEIIVMNFLKNNKFSNSNIDEEYFIDFKTYTHNLNWEREIVTFKNIKLDEIVNISKNIQHRILRFDSENQIVNGLFYLTNYGEIRIISRSLDEPIVLNKK